MPRGNHALSIASNGGQREDTKLFQHLQLCQHGEFWHVSVSERQRLWLCGQNVCEAFVRLYCNQRRRAIEQWRPTTRQKHLYLHHQGEFQHNYFVVVSLHHGDHGGAVRIFVGHSEVVKHLLLPSALARGSEWGIYFSLYTYVHTYVRTYRNMSCSGMLIGMLRVSCRPIQFYLL